MTARWFIRLVAISAIAVCPLVAVANAVLGWPGGVYDLLYGGCAVAFVAVGWLIAERRATNAVGPLLLAFGALFAWYLPADLYLHLPKPTPGAAFVALIASMLDAPMFILIGILLIVFPDGRLLSSRWRINIAAGLAGICLVIVGSVFNPGPLAVFPEYASPFAIDAFPGAALVYAAYAIMLGLLLLGATSLAIRWRRGNTSERAQIKWVATASLLVLASELVNVATFRSDDPNGIVAIIATVAIALVPIAIGIAVLRYRLYAIDRIVSRTIVYGSAVAILAAAFVAIVLTVQTLLSPALGGDTIAVAASTLAVFALFQPVVGRVRRTVDRRFDRARFDAEQVVAAFADRLRTDMDLPAVNLEIARTAGASVRPATLSVWLRDPQR